MKKSLTVLLLTSMLALPLAVNAADKSSATQTTQAEPAAPDVTKFDKQMAEAQKNMQKMHEQMAKINATQDPQERQKLMKTHWKTMQSTMPMMQGMMGSMGCPMMGGNMGNGMMMGDHMMNGNMMGWHDMDDYYSNLTPEQQKQRQYMMDQYMGMQNMMMDNMMQHQNWMMQPTQ